MTNSDLIKEVAKVSGATIKDTKEFVKVFERVIREKISMGESFKAFDISYSVNDMPERSGFNPLTKEHTVFPATKRLVVKAASSLKNIAKGKVALEDTDFSDDSEG